MEQFLFVSDVVWTTQKITDGNIKKAQLLTAQQDHALMWYIKYSSNNPLLSLSDTKDDLNKDFSKHKSDSQSVIGFK